MSNLTGRRCRPCEGGVEPLRAVEAQALLAQLCGWEMNTETSEIRRVFTFEDFHQVMAFVNAVAWIAHREDHHPCLEVGYRTCTVRYRTHAIGGLSENDFICASKVDDLV